MIQQATPTIFSPNPSFAGHQTFALRSGWLKKGLDAVQDPSVGGESVFRRPDAIVTLGVGKNMVQSIRHWVLVTQMAADEDRGRLIRTTQIGEKLFGKGRQGGWDPFLEDDATLWLLHWQLAGPGSGAFSWVWTFNMVRDVEFSKDNLVEAITNAAATAAGVPKPPSIETVTRDVECLLHTYVAPESRSSDDQLDCPLQSVALLQPGEHGLYRFAIGPKPSLPPRIFTYALLRFHEQQHPGAGTLSLWDVTYGEGSPGMVFKLDEDSVLEYLDDLADISGGAVRFEDSPLVRHVVLDPDRVPDPLSVLERYYA